MSADYLWDGTGTPDPFVAELERVLRPLRYQGRVPTPATGGARRAKWVLVAAIAASVALLSVVTYVLLPAPGVPAAPVSWTLEGVGRVKTGAATVEGAGDVVGRLVETGPGASATLTSTRGAVLTVGELSRVRLFDLGDEAQRVRLEQGSVFSQPTKSPRAVEVELAHGVAVIEPGTACLIAVNEGQGGGIEVKHGDVRIDGTGVTTRLGGGGRVPIRPDGLGTPRSGQAGAALEGALSKFDEARAAGDHAAQRMLLGDVLKAAGSGDDVTLWNLMYRVDDEGRKRIVGRARQLTKSMWQVDFDGLMRLDRDAMEAWWRLFSP